jgi:molybdopterin synthase catalytic subunit
MSVHVQISAGPLPAEAPEWNHSGAGSVIEFRGIIRPMEQERPIDAIEYDAYRPMADEQLERIANDLVDEYGLIAMSIEHSMGQVMVGECGFRLRIASAHRAEGLAATAAFIDLLKQDVPIFKVPDWSEASHSAGT